MIAEQHRREARRPPLQPPRASWIAAGLMRRYRPCMVTGAAAHQASGIQRHAGEPPHRCTKRQDKLEPAPPAVPLAAVPRASRARSRPATWPRLERVDLVEHAGGPVPWPRRSRGTSSGRRRGTRRRRACRCRAPALLEGRPARPRASGAPPCSSRCASSAAAWNAFCFAGDISSQTLTFTTVSRSNPTRCEVSTICDITS